MVMLAQPDQRAAHRDHVVVRMRAEHDDALGNTSRRPVAARAPRLAAGPAGDRILHALEYFDIQNVVRSARRKSSCKPCSL